MSRFNVKPILSIEPPPRPVPKDIKPNAVRAMNSVHMTHVGAGGDDEGVYEEAPRKRKNTTNAEKRKAKLAKAASGVKGLMALEPTKKMVEEYITHRIAALDAEDD